MSDEWNESDTLDAEIAWAAQHGTIADAARVRKAAEDRFAASMAILEQQEMVLREIVAHDSYAADVEQAMGLLAQIEALRDEFRRTL